MRIIAANAAEASSERLWPRRRRAFVGLLLLAVGALLAWSSRHHPSIDLLDSLQSGAGSKDPIEIRSVAIDGVTRHAILAHPTHSIRLQAVPVHPGARLQLSIGVREDVWDLPGDGVLFRAYAELAETKTHLFSHYVDSKRNVAHRRWIPIDVPLTEKLSRGSGVPSAVDILLVTSPGFRADSEHDAPVWADLKVTRGRRPTWPSLLRSRLPNVLLVSLDTLRADHVGAFGYHRGTTPEIDRIAAQGYRFIRAYAPANHTLQSHVSVLTGLYPDTHGVSPGMAEAAAVGVTPLANSRVTLAETLQAHGYLTAGFVYDCVWLARRFGIAQGFEDYAVRPYDAATMNERDIFPWLEAHQDEPFFLFVHYYDVHSDWKALPYDAPDRFRTKYDAAYDGSFDGCDGAGVCATRYLMQLDTRNLPVEASDLAYIRSLYDAGVEATDHAVGRLIERLRSLRLLENTLIVVMSDHGEEFREHGQFIHGQMYDEILRIPLIFRLPNRIGAGGQSYAPVNLLAVMPTILEIVGLAAEEPIEGRSLLPLMRGRDAETPQPIFVFGRDSQGIIEWPWKLLQHGGSVELYDLAADPQEQTDLSHLEKSRVEQLRQQLSARQRSPSLTDSAPVEKPGDADLERLRALGYLRD